MCNLIGEPVVIRVPINKDGQVYNCIVEIWFNLYEDRYMLNFNGNLLRQSPEGLHAVLGQALMALKGMNF